MEKEYWEYMMVVCNAKGFVIDSEGVKNILNVLNKLGKESWEGYATEVVKDENGATRIQHWLKRRIDPKDLPMLG